MFFAIAGMIASITSGIIKGVVEVQNAKAQMKAVHEQAQIQVNERARKAKKLLSEQKNAFLKSGVYFDGTPEVVFNETYDFARQDMAAINNDALKQQKQLKRQGQTAFATNVLEGIKNGAMSYGMGAFANGAGSTFSMFGKFANTKVLSGGYDVSNSGILSGGTTLA